MVRYSLAHHASYLYYRRNVLWKRIDNENNIVLKFRTKNNKTTLQQAGKPTIPEAEIKIKIEFYPRVEMKWTLRSPSVNSCFT